MLNHRQIALAVERGRRFLKALKALTEAGPVTKEQLEATAKEHGIYKSIAEALVVSGVIAVYELPEPACDPEEVLLLEPGKAYLAYWKVQPDDEMAYYSVLMTGMFKSIDAYSRFMLSCNLPPYSHCQRCDLVFPSRLGKKFCSDKCRALAHYDSKKRNTIEPTLKDRAITVLKSIRDFVRAL